MSHAEVRALSTIAMSTQIRFRLSGNDEATFLSAARHAGLSPDAYARVRALTPVEPGETIPPELDKRLEALESKITALAESRPGAVATPATVIQGIEVDDLVREVRREVMRGFNAILTLLDAETLPEQNSQAPPDRSN